MICSWEPSNNFVYEIRERFMVNENILFAYINNKCKQFPSWKYLSCIIFSITFSLDKSLNRICISCYVIESIAKCKNAQLSDSQTMQRMRREIREVVKDKWVASPATPRLPFPELKGSDTSGETQHNTTPAGESNLRRKRSSHATSN